MMYKCRQVMRIKSHLAREIMHPEKKVKQSFLLHEVRLHDEPKEHLRRMLSFIFFHSQVCQISFSRYGKTNSTT